MIRVLAAVCSIFFAACGPLDSIGGGQCAAGVLAGDLVISEIMANPAGADAGHEWIEIYNATAEPVNLAGLRLGVEAVDGSGSKTLLLDTEAGTLPARSYYVIATTSATPLPEWADLGIGDALGALRNTNGRVLLVCGSTTVDAVTYSTMPEAAALGFDGAVAPDALANDDPERWCAGIDEYEPGMYGSPGARNPACREGGSAVPTQCTMPDGTTRAVQAPTPGDLVITEIMADPKAAADDTGEYIEVLATADVDLNGIALGAALDDIDQVLSQSACLTLSAGQRALFARSADPNINGGLPDVDVELNFALTNGGGTLLLAFGADIIDTVEYPAATAGVAYSLDPDKSNAADNDLAGNWCAATSTYGAGDWGTPKATNDQCPVTLADGQCLEAGVARAIDSPQAGEVIITEFMANPAQVADTEGEWIELYALGSFDLNGLELGRIDLVAGPEEVAATLTADECLPVAAGDYVLLARSAAATVNGGLPTPRATFGFSLNNSNRGLWVGVAGTRLDEVTYTTTISGAARNLDPGNFTADANDDLDAWCDAISSYGLGDLGTPGAANTSCGGGSSVAVCWDPVLGDVRTPVVPQPGDLVITEFLSDPQGSDGSGFAEWIEFTARAAVDLQGLEVGQASSSAVFDTTECTAVDPGERILVAGSAVTHDNGGLTNVDLVKNFTLLQDNGELFLRHGLQIIDAVTYTTTNEGVARSLDAAVIDAVGNDSESVWCDAVDAYGIAGNLGTPGAANPACPLVVPAGYCWAGGVTRAVVGPQPGDLVISEFLSDPAGTDTGKEWFELYARVNVDLNGLSVTRTTADLFAWESTLCTSVAAGTYLLFAGSASSVANAGLPAVDFVFGDSLINDDRDLFVRWGGLVVDAVTYTTTQPGVARKLDDDALSASANDDEAVWCDAVAPYGSETNYGTPGAANPGCGTCWAAGIWRDPVQPVTGDVVITEIMANPDAVDEASGSWFEIYAMRTVDLIDLSYDSGGTPESLAVTACTALPAGTFAVFAGSASAASNGGIDPVTGTFAFALGNSGDSLNLRRGSWILDTVTYVATTADTAWALSGNRFSHIDNDLPANFCDARTTYGTQGMLGSPGVTNPVCPETPDAHGELVISELMKNPEGAVGEPAGEFFELYNPSATVTYDLYGCAISDESGSTHAIAAHVYVEPLSYVTASNGAAPGFTPDYDYATLTFSNSSDDQLYLTCGSVLIDRVRYNDTQFPDVPGSSMLLAASALDATANDDGAHWCDAFAAGAATYATGNYGSPGTAFTCP